MPERAPHKRLAHARMYVCMYVLCYVRHRAPPCIFQILKGGVWSKTLHGKGHNAGSSWGEPEGAPHRRLAHARMYVCMCVCIMVRTSPARAAIHHAMYCRCAIIYSGSHTKKLSCACATSIATCVKPYADSALTRRLRVHTDDFEDLERPMRKRAE